MQRRFRLISSNKFIVMTASNSSTKLSHDGTWSSVSLLFVDVSTYIQQPSTITTSEAVRLTDRAVAKDVTAL